MPTFTNAKDHTPGALRFDALSVVSFPAITLAASQVNTTVQTAIALPCHVKIVAMTAMTSAAIAGSVTGINIVAGTAAESGTGAANTLAGNGTQLFAADAGQAPALNTAWLPYIFNVPQNLVDVIWTNAALSNALTARIATAAATTGTLYISLLVKAYDATQTKPLYTFAGVLTI